MSGLYLYLIYRISSKSKLTLSETFSFPISLHCETVCLQDKGLDNESGLRNGYNRESQISNQKIGENCDLIDDFTFIKFPISVNLFLLPFME